MMVVVSAIAILIALLFPAMSHVRQAAARVKCMSNMRQIAIASIGYATDNAWQLPYCNWANSVDSSPYYGKGWLFSMPQFRVGYPPASGLNGYWLITGNAPRAGVQTGVLWPYLNTLEIYHCPMDNDPSFWRGTEYMTSYLMNGAQCAFARTPTGLAMPCRGFAIPVNRS